MSARGHFPFSVELFTGEGRRQTSSVTQDAKHPTIFMGVSRRSISKKIIFNVDGGKHNNKQRKELTRMSY
jgi:hypothetical protein